MPGLSQWRVDGDEPACIGSARLVLVMSWCAVSGVGHAERADLNWETGRYVVGESILSHIERDGSLCPLSSAASRSQIGEGRERLEVPSCSTCLA